jgi:hypothetical protein
MPLAATLTWQIVYILRGVIALKLVKGRASAVNAACEIYDAGGDVYRAEIAGTLIALNPEHLRQIWMERKDGTPG